jgi:hypothetical protein
VTDCVLEVSVAVRTTHYLWTEQISIAVTHDTCTVVCPFEMSPGAHSIWLLSVILLDPFRQTLI